MRIASPRVPIDQGAASISQWALKSLRAYRSLPITLETGHYLFNNLRKICSQQ